MKKIIISTDSTADLSKELIEKYDVKTIPLHVRFGDEAYLDGVNITTEKLYELVDELGYLPKTQAVSPGSFESFFKEYLDQGYQIVHISIGSKISATYQSAKLAVDLLETNDVFVVDSQNLSSGIALLVLKASDFRKQGLEAKEIAKKAQALVPKVRSQFAIKTLEYLHKGDRAKGIAAFVGGILQVKPIIKVENGTLDVYKKSIGKMSKALDIMIDDLLTLGDKVDKDYIFITHSMASNSFDYIKEKLEGKIEVKNLYEGHAGCVISSHCGAGTIGILYIVNE
ncbi:DegV family protein [Acholeplasma hippikon]|uniref:Fatty acid-binding protein DegV-like protein n=1 Tax=Acholeplasma hippikon TaxID=264636 RepID=A0A449BIM2_9MOLU|nr:DegV family protein [Acholeplasma hippikon]VEU82282.1 Fatty acid-binding protein DegV-like protein [Acholeplasma hippikon]